MKRWASGAQSALRNQSRKRHRVSGLYNFDFNVGRHGKAKSDLTIYTQGRVYICKQAIKQFSLKNERLRWGEDKEQHTLALKRDPKGRKVQTDKSCVFTCPPVIAEQYAGRYNLKEEDGVLILIKANQED